MIIPLSLGSPHHLPSHHLLVHIHRCVLPWVRRDPLAYDVRIDGPRNEVNIQLDSQRRQLDNGLHCHPILCGRGQQFGQGLDVLGVRCFQLDTGKPINIISNKYVTSNVYNLKCMFSSLICHSFCDINKNMTITRYR